MKSKQLYLIEVDREHPTRKERIEAFKAGSVIFTHYAGKNWGRKNRPWSAFLVPVGSTKHPVELIAERCCCYEESGQLVTGETEVEAIMKLCALNEIRCDL